ncbi:SusC/RagA family TonB-linked outer membrane protein [Gemmatimonas sp.]|uniref:SusC/RagA family TonB-linked outer membrane protein n=1 Tax=Gemmatimonas sp. TaxID=1962908 RepID=UPI0035623E63
MTQRSLLGALAVVAAAFAAPVVHAQQATTGTVSGRVTDAATGQPIGAAQIQVVGTTLGAQSNQDGMYSIRAVPTGAITLRVLRLGFSEGRQSATVSAAQVTTVNLQIKSVPAALNPVVTTATGDQRRIEVGNSIAQINAAEVVETRGVSNMADLLTARAPGVLVTPGTQTGAGMRVRIRGTSSVALSNNPIYVIDGIRIDGSTGSSTLSVGGTTPSRVGDLNPEEIESMEVVRGPSAATLYGTDAANGVIVIKTKRGVAGKPQWNYYTEQTALTDRNAYPTAYRAWRNGTTAATTSTRSNAVQCFLTQKAAGSCAIDSVSSYNLHDDPESTPYGIGYRQQHGLQLKGGSDAVRYFLHGEWEAEDGVTKLPEFDARKLAAAGTPLSAIQLSPNNLNKITSRANLNITLSPKADVTVSAGYTNQDLRLPQSDDSGTAGVAANVYGGPGFKYNQTATGDTLFGWRQFTPRDIFQSEYNQSINRIISSVGSNYRPMDWLALRGTFGVDYLNRVDTQLCRFQNCPDIGADRQGYKRDNRTSFYTYTVDVGATATKKLSSAIESKTTAGVQMFRNIFDRNGATGLVLPPGATTVTAGATAQADESSSESRTLGAFVEQNVGFNDRLFLTAALRSDRNSAFGANFKTVFYPKIAASWVLSQESFFPKPQWLDQLRLRSAYGASGVQPGTIDAVQFYSATAGRQESGDVPALVYSTLGNQNLRPERSTETEIGLDGTYWNARINTEITYYNKSSKDALVSRILPPSLGTGATARLENLGSVRNRGFEALISAQLIQRNAFGLDVTLNAAYNDNELISLGGQPSIGVTQQQRQGYPLYGWWSRQLTGFEDKNGDGIITYNASQALSEIMVTDTSVFIGYSMPKTEIGFTTGIDLFNKALRVNALVDYKGGHKIYNNTERIRCASRFNCSGLLNTASTLEEQARVVMVREHPSRSVAGYFEDGDYLRFRELSASYQVPARFANRLFRGRSLSATASVRNLGILWTKYTGVDPEAFFSTGDAPSEFQAFGPPTYFAFRFTFGF